MQQPLFHPWRILRGLGDWTLFWEDLLQIDVLGLTNYHTKTITLEKTMLYAERRCTLAHELEHIHRGPAPIEPVLAAREELLIDKIVARKLIQINHLAEALAWSQDAAEVADELAVDVATLKARLDHLHPAERAYLRARLEIENDSA